MGQKIKNGGSVGRAKLGYLNVRDTSEGREIRTVEVDPVRAPFIRLAFALYATGKYTLNTLHTELDERGLRTRASGRWPSGPVSMTKARRKHAAPGGPRRMALRGDQSCAGSAHSHDSVPSFNQRDRTLSAARSCPLSAMSTAP